VFLIWWKNQTQSFSLILWNDLLILKTFPVTRCKVPNAAILTLKMRTGSRLWFCNIISEAAHDKYILAHFPCSQWEDGTREHRSTTEKEILRSVSVSIFKISKWFHRNKYKLLIVQGSVKFLKDLDNYRRITESTDKNVLTFKKISIHLMTLFLQRRKSNQLLNSSIAILHKNFGHLFNLFVRVEVLIEVCHIRPANYLTSVYY